MVLDDYLQWLDNNYGKKNVLAKQKSQDTFSLKEKVSSKPVITTQQIADLLNTNETKKDEQNWISKKELMNICKCSDKTLEQIVSSFNIEVNFDIKNHIKTGVLWKQ